MKRIIAWLFTLCASIAIGQPYGNEWINYNQSHLYVKVHKTGIHQIPYNALNAGFISIGQNISAPTFNHDDIQVFQNGEEIPIYVEDGGDGTLDPGDYLEFYAKKNTGWLDSLLYDQPENQNNRQYSLFTDTSYVFITLNSGNANLRYASFSNVNYANFSPAPFVMHTAYQEYTTNYETGATDFSGKTEPEYTEGEGWFDNVFTYLANRTKNLLTPNPYLGTGAPQSRLKAVVTGASNATNISGNDHRLGISIAGNTLFDQSYEGYKLIRINEVISPNLLSNGNTGITFQSLPLPSAPASDRQAVSWVSITYPQIPNFANQPEYRFEVMPNALNTRLDVSGFSAGSNTYLYDLTNQTRIAITPNSSGFQAIIPAGGQKELFVSSPAAITTITSIERVGSVGAFENYSTNPPDSAYLIITHPSLSSSAQQFALRKQQQGFDTEVILIDDLYLQYAYGIRKHPLAIRNFLNDALQNWPTPPQFLFLIGKSISDYLCRNNPTNYQNNLVPSWGFPTTDNLLSAGLVGTQNETAIATGRLVAKSSQEVLSYAEKVNQFQAAQNNAYTLSNKEWMKNVLHFGGGANANEQRTLRNYLLDYEALIEDTNYGGSVTSIFKNTTNVIQTSVTDSVKTLIDNGVSLLTFFGHAAGTALDISIEDVEAYDNFGKYFLFLANSCNVGDIHTPVQPLPGVNENFVLTPGKGAIAFIASVTLGYPSRLDLYTESFYEHLTAKSYGKPIGKLMQEAVKEVQSIGIMKSTCLEMCLHGDPSLVLNTHSKPEFVLTPERIFTTPEELSAELDSFELNVVVTNIGKAVNRKAVLEVRRFFPSGGDTIYTITGNAPTLRDTLSLTLPVDRERGVGENRFEVSYDYPIVQIEEVENSINNTASFEVWISSDELIPIYPKQQSIIPSNTFSFLTATADQSAPTRTYFFEIDTTDQFNSPLLQQLEQNASGGIVEWQPNLSYWPDSVVYYWRVTPTPNPDPKWREHSFTYIPNKRGWGQTDFDQGKRNDFTFINFDKTSQTLDFLPNVRQLRAQIKGHPTSQQEYNFHEYRLDGVLREFGVCPPAAPSIYVAIFDSLTLEPWGTHYENLNAFPPISENPNNSFGNTNNLGGCRARVEYFFTYPLTNSTSVNALFNLLENEIPDGNYVLAWTVIRGDFGDSTIWTNQRFQVFENMGATQIRSVGDSIPYIFFAQKGRPNTAVEAVGNTFNDVVVLNANLTNNANSGKIQTPLIGPAQNWGQLNWKWRGESANIRDSVLISLHGITANGTNQLLSTYKTQQGSINNLNAQINAATYPFLSLTLTLSDDSLTSPVQPLYTHVVYEPLPELAVDLATHYQFDDDTLLQGQTGSVQVSLRNLSDVDAPLVLKHYTIDQGRSTEVQNVYREQPEIPAFGSVTDTFSFSTSTLNGNYNYSFDLNPRFPDSVFMPEQYLFNNGFSKRFYVAADQTNPLLDVTFDGIHILDGDIVSPEPSIVIRLDDENPYLPLDDTSFFSVFLIDPQNNRARIPFQKGSVENMVFKKASLPENQAEITYHPTFEQDGVYELIVQANDASNNRSGDNAYRISFEVINRSTITEVMNYPNPFTTSTRFVFTLTGSKIPEIFTIQILTVSGKVIREITKQELGPINIGRNITQYAWDGTDEFGDRLGNGVYLYRVITKINGEEVEHRGSGADSFFTKGFGKMYLMR